MLGAMQDWELRVTSLLDHAASQHPTRRILSRWADGSETASNWAEIRRDALRMVQALRRLGIGPADRVATLAMNHSRHLVSWYGAAGAGGILHTINPRLFDDQLEYIVNHAEDRVLIYDRQFQPIVDRLRPRWTTVEHYFCFDGGDDARAFADWIGAEDGDADWTTGDEREACMLCYTSGTTGNPKGVLYEHRSTILHALSAIQPSIMCLSERSVVLPVVPMFHAACWALPWAGAAVGASFVFSQTNDPETVCDLVRRENVDIVGGVPTVWLSLFQHMDQTGTTLPSLKQAIVGGTAPPRALVERLMRQGIRVAQAWGMTETSPIATVASEPANWDALDFDGQVEVKVRQGRAAFGAEVRCVSLDDPAVVLPWDGVTAGALQVRGAWVIRRYFKAEADAADADGWFDTGDVAVIHPDGTLQLTDRTKDVIKSGGEWISSVELENAAMAYPGVAEAAAIGVHHPKWDERPILVVVKKPGAEVDGEGLRALLASRVAKWWLPDAIEFVDELPHTGTGKVSKKDLRERFGDYRLPGT